MRQEAPGRRLAAQLGEHRVAAHLDLGGAGDGGAGARGRAGGRKIAEQVGRTHAQLVEHAGEPAVLVDAEKAAQQLQGREEARGVCAQGHGVGLKLLAAPGGKTLARLLDACQKRGECSNSWNQSRPAQKNTLLPKVSCTE